MSTFLTDLPIWGYPAASCSGYGCRKEAISFNFKARTLSPLNAGLFLVDYVKNMA